VSEATAQRVEQIFREADAYREGHFKLKSGRHADRYVEKFEVLQWPERVTELCRLMVEIATARSSRQRRTAEEERPFDVVLGPTTGGVILAYECARQLGVRGIFAEEVADGVGGTRRELRRGFAIAPGERVLLVDDVITTGGSLLAMLPVVEQAAAELAHISVLVDRSGGLQEVESGQTGRRYPVHALWTLNLPTHEPGPANCAGCAAGQSLVAPGSSGTKVPAAL
jgi:orotate phosphoribosyltransferase